MFGDWNTNGDPVAICLYDLDTKEETVLFPRKNGPSAWDDGLYSEAVGRVLDIDGYLYVPHIDGLGYWEGCGYATNDGGWHNVRLPGQPLHVFDMLQTDDGLWACGSKLTEDQSTGQAALWFRPNGGEWIVRLVGMPGDFRRFYAMAFADGRVWVRDDKTYGVTPNDVVEGSIDANLNSYADVYVRTPAGTLVVGNAGGLTLNA